MAKVIFIMGVSGSGKTTVLKESGILEHPDIVYVPSWTTRPLRPGEVNGVKYHHVDEATFQQAIHAGRFLEYACVHEHYRYGTPYDVVMEVLMTGKHVIKELDVYGLLKIEQEHKIDEKYTSLFLDIPLELMIQRIQQRGVLPQEELQKRIESADFEREQAQVHCDHIIDATQPLALVIENVIDLIKREIR